MNNRTDIVSATIRPSKAKKSTVLAFGLLAFGLVTAAGEVNAQPTIVLIGGKKSGFAEGQHDYPAGVIKLQRLIKASPEFSKLNPVVKLFPGGFPKDLKEIGDASVVVLYNGTVPGVSGSTNPNLEPGARNALKALMDRGVGIVALHQSFTITPNDDGSAIADWIGGTRPAVSDYSMEVSPITVVNGTHPVNSGVSNFDHLDEYYSKIDFGKAKVTPLLNARAHVQHRAGKGVYEDPAKPRVFAWAQERPDGGRAFTFAGGHFVETFDQPQVRTMLLNAIMWAAKEDVPQAGVTSTLQAAPRIGMAPAPEPQRIVLPAADVKPEPQPWGMLEWYAHRSLENSSNVTVGKATISPGKENPVHWHPNCDEVLHVLQGRIMHLVGDKEYEMRAGDTVVIPEGVFHNARNIGTEDAVLLVSFNSADRVAIGE